jgi:hypothetical protein
VIKKKNACRILAGNPKGKSPRWEDNIKMYLK